MYKLTIVNLDIPNAEPIVVDTTSFLVQTDDAFYASENMGTALEAGLKSVGLIGDEHTIIGSIELGSIELDPERDKELIERIEEDAAKQQLINKIRNIPKDQR